MKKTLYLLTLIITLFTEIGFVKAQKVIDGELIFPTLTFGPSVGYESGKLGDAHLNGFNTQVRIGYVPDVFPIFFFGAEAEYSALSLELEATNLRGNGLSFQGLVGMALPLYLAIDKLPKGAGLPIYVGYGINSLDFDGVNTKLTGTRFKIGAVVPIPLKLKMALLIEREFFNYDQGTASENSLGLNDLDGGAWKFKLQFPFALIKRK